jgi:hypothetical protein
MFTTSTKRAAAIAVLAFATVFTAACGPTDAASPNAGPTTEGVEGSGALGTAPGEPTDGPTDISPTYPDTPEGYSQEVIEAWAGDDSSWFDALTTEGAGNEIVDIPVSPYDDWTLLRCDGAAGSSYCGFTNPNGDLLTIRISNQLLGQPDAAVDILLDITVYPNNGEAYVKEFIEAWQFGNTARMLKLSNPDVVDSVPNPPTGSITYPEPDCCGGGLLQVKVKWGTTNVRFDVGTTLLGGPNAILDYAPVLGFTS